MAQSRLFAQPSDEYFEVNTRLRVWGDRASATVEVVVGCAGESEPDHSAHVPIGDVTFDEALLVALDAYLVTKEVLHAAMGPFPARADEALLDAFHNLELATKR